MRPRSQISLRRISCASLLLLLLLVQWVAGFSFIQLTYLVDSGTPMNEQEEQIASAIYENFGLSARVQIHTEEEVHILNSLGYGAPFILTSEVEGETRLYTLDERGPDIEAFTMALRKGDTPDSDDSGYLCVQQLFAQYCFGNCPAPVALMSIDDASISTMMPSLAHLCDRVRFSPPPEFA